MILIRNVTRLPCVYALCTRHHDCNKPDVGVLPGTSVRDDVKHQHDHAWMRHLQITPHRVSAQTKQRKAVIPVQDGLRMLLLLSVIGDE